jgi:hypothetical protein
MKRLVVLTIALCFFVLWTSDIVHSQDELKIWEEFVASLKNDTFSLEDIWPEYAAKETLMRWMQNLCKAAERQGTWSDWEAAPEIFHVENYIHFLVNLNIGGQKQTRCLTFLKKNGKWFFARMEMIFLRLDKISSLPTSQFPDTTEQQKAWMREEIYWSKLILNFYIPLVKEKGKDFVLNLLKDGPGYFVGAKTWVPFVPPHRAFILWLCWHQAHLRGNHVTLEKLNDHEALVRMQTHFFWIYKSASHLKPIIPMDDYRQIFETLWQDRANNAGWKLDITYSDEECLECVFRFTREESQS